MGNIIVLDGTLRDGGYVNHFLFEIDNIKSIIRALEKARINIIECGFLKLVDYSKDKSIYDSIDRLQSIIGEKDMFTQYVVMIRYGDYPISHIQNQTETLIDGIRLSFHEHEISSAFDFANQLSDKGYKVFLQPVSTMTYSTHSIFKMIEGTNKLMPYAFYIVDTFGSLLIKDIPRYFSLFDKELNAEIKIGFHSHNNLRMSLQNACEICKLASYERDVIIDTSVLGMGRGAGNLDSKSFLQYINANYNGQYNIDVISVIEQKYVSPFKEKYKWGYDPAYELTARLKCHPSYASYLLEKNMSIIDIERYISLLPHYKRILFDRNYIERICLEYKM